MSKFHLGAILLAGWVSIGIPASAQDPPAAAPAAFGVAGREVLLSVQGVGAQVYECKPAAGGLAWSFREPTAALIKNGQTVGRHYGGPTWALADGGQVRGKQAAAAPGAGPFDVAWLKLDVTDNAGVGALKGATTVLRLNTHGGVLAGPCDASGALRAQAYAADYLFLR